MKKLILFTIAAMMICGVQAQEGQGQGFKKRGEMTPEKMAQFETNRMTKEFNLDKTTQAKIQEINLRYAKEQNQMRKERKESNQKEREANRDEMRKKMDDMQSKKDAEFEKVLSKKDFTAYKQKRDEMRKKMEERRQNSDFGGERKDKTRE